MFLGNLWTSPVRQAARMTPTSAAPLSPPVAVHAGSAMPDPDAIRLPVAPMMERAESPWFQLAKEVCAIRVHSSAREGRSRLFFWFFSQVRGL